MKTKNRFEVRAIKVSPMEEMVELETNFDSFNLARGCADVAIEKHFTAIIYAWVDTIDAQGQVMDSEMIAIYEPFHSTWDKITL